MSVRSIDEQRLRELVELLVEDGDGGGGDFGGGDFGGGGFGGGGFGGGDSTYWSRWSAPSGGFFNGLISPFTDVIKTALAGVLDLSNRVWGLIKTTVVTVLKSLVPFVKNEVDKIERQTKARTVEIERKYASVLNLFQDPSLRNDFKLVMFLLNPGAYVSTTLALKGASSLGVVRDVFAGSRRFESVILEQDISQVVDDINRSKLASQMHDDAVLIVRERLSLLQGVVDRVRSMSYDELIKMLGTKVKDFDLGEDEQVAKDTITRGAQKEVAKLISNIIESEMKTVADLKLGTRKNEILNMYSSVLSKISA